MIRISHMRELLTKATTISKTLSLPFTIDTAGWYILSVSARVRDEKQIGAGATDDEDLRVEVDGEKFPKLSNPQRYLDSPAAFSGGKLRNTLKTVYFITRCRAGKHAISLIPDQGALIDRVAVQNIADPSHIIFDLNQQAEDGNNKPWITFVLMNLGLKSFTIKAQTRWRFPDGDDIKIIVDDKIKKNKSSILHRNWIFASSIIRKFFGSETSEKTFEENLEIQKLHYIEIWSDKTPTMYSVSFNLEASSPEEPEKDEPKPIVQTYKQGSAGQNYNKYDKDIADAVKDWNEKFLSQEYPPPEPLDPNLVKAIIYIETGMGQHEGANDQYPDIMQVGDIRNPAIHTLNNDGWKDPRTGKIARESEINAEGIRKTVDYHGEANGDTPQQSIHWGVRWLYHKAQGITNSGARYWRPWSQAVRNYNSEGNIAYERKVYHLYEDGIDPFGNVLWEKSDSGGFVKMFLVFIMSALFVISVMGYALLSENGGSEINSYNELVLGSSIEKSEAYDEQEIENHVRNLIKESMVAYQKPQRDYGTIFKEPAVLCHEHERICFSELIFADYLDGLVEHMRSREQFIEAATVLGIISASNFSHSDVDGDGRNEVVMVIPDYLNREYMTVSVIDEVSGNFEMTEQRISRAYFNAPDSMYPMRPLHIIDLTGDAIPEIALFLSGGRWGGHLHVFSYHNGILEQRFQTQDVYAYPEYTFTDQNRNSIMEINLKGEKFDVIPFNFECMACQHMEVEETFEYNPRNGDFALTKQSYLGIPGAMHYALIDIAGQGYNHPLLRNWSAEQKERFAYTLNQLTEESNSGIFDTIDGKPVFDEGRDEATFQFKHNFHAQDIVAPPHETKEQEEERLSYYRESPVYSARFTRSAGQWSMVYFAEQEVAGNNFFEKD